MATTDAFAAGRGALLMPAGMTFVWSNRPHCTKPLPQRQKASSDAASVTQSGHSVFGGGGNLPATTPSAAKDIEGWTAPVSGVHRP